MTTRTCTVPHCQKPTTSEYSPHCKHHKSTNRRHGAPDQTGINKTELNPYLERVQARISKNPNSLLWPNLDDAWAAITEEATAVSNKRVGNRYARSAAHEFLNINADAQPREIVITALAMFILWHERPSRFVDDRAFRMQLARRVRALSTRHRGVAYNHTTGKQRPVYREMTPKAGSLIGQRLALAFGFAGIQLAELDKRDRQTAEQSRQSIIDAIKELK